MPFVLHILGLAILITGMARGLLAAGIATTWIAIVCTVVLGIGIMVGLSRTRIEDPLAPR